MHLWMSPDSEEDRHGSRHVYRNMHSSVGALVYMYPWTLKQINRLLTRVNELFITFAINYR